MKKDQSIIAWGTKGKVIGKKFVTTPKGGLYALHSEYLSSKKRIPLNCEATKVFVSTLDEVSCIVIILKNDVLF